MRLSTLYLSLARNDRDENKGLDPVFSGVSLGLAALIFAPAAVPAQLTTGTIEGVVHDTNGRPVADRSIAFTGGAGFHSAISSNGKGEFAITLPYGQYRLPSGDTVVAAPLQTVHVDLVMNGLAEIHVLQVELFRGGKVVRPH